MGDDYDTINFGQELICKRPIKKRLFRIMDKGQKKDQFAKARQAMVLCDLQGRDITDPAVLRVMSQIRREEFVLEQYRQQAYADGPLPTGCGQTISQPYIVALMTQQLRLNRDCEVLDVGTGSGYQTAILSMLAKKVYTVEKFGQLSESAQAVLGRLGVKNVEFLIGDGSCGWPEKKHFDRIMVTAAVPKMPQPLIQQLKQGGLIIAPVGYGWVQELVIWEKQKERIDQKHICEVRFVKLVGKHGFEQ